MDTSIGRELHAPISDIVRTREGDLRRLRAPPSRRRQLRERRRPRCGIKTDEDETLWANCADVKPTAVVNTGRNDDGDDADDAEGDDADRFIAAATKSKPAKSAAPALAKGTLDKGMKVQWKKGRHAGTGVVFWIGKNKFGDGMRAGVKDDETGETVWADADDCKPTD